MTKILSSFPQIDLYLFTRSYRFPGILIFIRSSPSAYSAAVLVMLIGVGNFKPIFNQIIIQIFSCHRTPAPSGQSRNQFRAVPLPQVWIFVIMCRRYLVGLYRPMHTMTPVTPSTASVYAVYDVNLRRWRRQLTASTSSTYDVDVVTLRRQIAASCFFLLSYFDYYYYGSQLETNIL
jgi:hypothetical protein